MKSKIKQDNPIPTLITYCIQNPQILYQIVTPHHKSHPLSVVPLSLSLVHLQPMQPPLEPTTTTTNRPTIHNHHKPQATKAKIKSNPKPKSKSKIYKKKIKKEKEKETHEMVQSDRPPQLWVLLVFI